MRFAQFPTFGIPVRATQAVFVGLSGQDQFIQLRKAQAINASCMLDLDFVPLFEQALALYTLYFLVEWGSVPAVPARAFRCGRNFYTVRHTRLLFLSENDSHYNYYLLD